MSLLLILTKWVAKKNLFPSLMTVQEQNKGTFPPSPKGPSQSVAASPYRCRPSLTCRCLPSSRRCPSLPVSPIQSLPPHVPVPPLPAGVTHPTSAASLASIASPYRFRVNFLLAPPLSVGAVSLPCRRRPCTQTCLTYLPAPPLEPASPLQPTPNILNYTVSRMQRKEQLKPCSLLYYHKNSVCLSFSICIIFCILLQ
jgi:hypothetical protein